MVHLICTSSNQVSFKGNIFFNSHTQNGTSTTRHPRPHLVYGTGNIQWIQKTGFMRGDRGFGAANHLSSSGQSNHHKRQFTWKAHRVTVMSGPQAIHRVHTKNPFTIHTFFTNICSMYKVQQSNTKVHNSSAQPVKGLNPYYSWWPMHSISQNWQEVCSLWFCAAIFFFLNYCLVLGNAVSFW